jgi:hypothetical protein
VGCSIRRGHRGSPHDRCAYGSSVRVWGLTSTLTIGVFLLSPADAACRPSPPTPRRRARTPPGCRSAGGWAHGTPRHTPHPAVPARTRPPEGTSGGSHGSIGQGILKPFEHRPGGAAVLESLAHRAARPSDTGRCARGVHRRGGRGSVNTPQPGVHGIGGGTPRLQFFL